MKKKELKVKSNEELRNESSYGRIRRPAQMPDKSTGRAMQGGNREIRLRPAHRAESEPPSLPQAQASEYDELGGNREIA